MTETAPKPHRLLFIDNLRWSAISMVVVLHAAVTYSHYGSWYFYDRAGTTRAEVIAFATYQSFQHAVAMGLLFGIAGYFAGGMIERRGIAGFLRERATRLGLPLLLYTLLVGPASAYFLAGAWHRGPTTSFPAVWLWLVETGRMASQSGPLWFCLVLLAFSLILAAWRKLVPAPPNVRPVPGARAVLSYAAVMAAITFAVGLALPDGAIWLNVEILDFPQYPLMFAAGLMAHRGDWPMRIAARTGRVWLYGGLAFAALAWAGLITQGGALTGHLRDYGGGWHWQAAAMDVWRSVTCVALTIGLITLFRDRFNGQGPLARFLARNAFGVYVFHPPILIAVTRVLQLWPADSVIKFFAASAVAVAVTFLFVGLVARRVPGIRAII